MEEVAQVSWFARLRARVVALSATPHATLAMAIVSVIDGSVFPIPPFALLIPMVLSHPKRALRYAVIGTLASLVGGLIGYGIGYAISTGLTSAFNVDPSLPLKFTLRSWHVDTTLREVLTTNFWLLAIACSILPTPYKIVAIGSGLVGVSIPAFILASIIGRSARFFGVSFAFAYFGPRAARFFRLSGAA